MDISIIICTYNRSLDLVNTLNSLMDMDITPHIAWEVLVVDNNSTDETKKVVEDKILKSGAVFKYIFEVNQGKSYALNRGIKEATGRIIAFIDDDIIVSKEWLITIINEFNKDATIDILGGRVELYNDKDRPLTIRNSREKKILTQSTFNPSYIPLLGCNMAIKREVIKKIGIFDTQFGPGSKKNAIVEDVDYLYRAIKSGLKIIYTPNILVLHNHGRRLDSDVQKVITGYLIGRGAFYRKYIFSGDQYILKLAFWEFYAVLKRMVRYIIKKRSIMEELKHIKLLLVGVASYSNR